MWLWFHLWFPKLSEQLPNLAQLSFPNLAKLSKQLPSLANMSCSKNGNALCWRGLRHSVWNGVATKYCVGLEAVVQRLQSHSLSKCLEGWRRLLRKPKHGWQRKNYDCPNADWLFSNRIFWILGEQILRIRAFHGKHLCALVDKNTCRAHFSQPSGLPTAVAPSTGKSKNQIS